MYANVEFAAVENIRVYLNAEIGSETLHFQLLMWLDFVNAQENGMCRMVERCIYYRVSGSHNFLRNKEGMKHFSADWVQNSKATQMLTALLLTYLGTWAMISAIAKEILDKPYSFRSHSYVLKLGFIHLKYYRDEAFRPPITAHKCTSPD